MVTHLTSHFIAAQPLRWDLFLAPLPFLILVGCLIVTALVWILWQKREEKDFLPNPKSLGASDQNLKLFYGLVPIILGIHVAIPLLINGIEGDLFFSRNTIKNGWSNWMGLSQITIALSLFYGGLTRPAAALLGLLWVLGIDSIGLIPMLNSIQFLGFAAFFYLAGRGPYAIDRILFPRLEPNTNYIHQALFFLRVCIGLNFIIYAFTQHLANIPEALTLLNQSPFLNTPFLSNEFFVLITGGLEILAGLLIALGAFPRTVSILTLMCINATLTISNWHELIDYLPTYGALALFLVWEPNNPKQKLLWIDGIRSNSFHRSSSLIE